MSLRLVTVMVVALVVSVSAQIRPTPQPPPRRTAPAPRTPPPPKRDTSEPAETKPAQDRGPQGSAPQSPNAAADPKVDAGAALYKKNGCYECHVNDAQGGPQGPRLGPNPIPFPRFVAYVRNPTGDMPPFTAKVISDQDLASIYAFLQARPTPPPVKDVPLLAP
jgi:mono/diheme cytochrome c family protein